MTTGIFSITLFGRNNRADGGRRRIFPSCLLSLFCTAVLSSSCAKSDLVRTEDTKEVGLESIRICADEECRNNKPGFTLPVKDGNVIFFLDLRATGNLNLVSNIKNSVYKKPKIFIKSERGETIGSVDLNYRVSGKKKVVEDFYDEVPITRDGVPSGVFVVKRPKKKTASNETVENTECGDQSILPQAVPVRGAVRGKRPCIIYVTFDVTYNNTDIEESGEKKEIKARVEKTTVASVCTPPFHCYIARPGKEKAEETAAPEPAEEKKPSE